MKNRQHDKRLRLSLGKGKRKELNMRKFGTIWVLVILAFVLTACPGGGTKPPEKDTSRPTIVSLKPAPNSRGVLDSATMEIEFSEEMDQQSAQAAFQELADSKNTPFGSLTFNWSNDGKTMFVKPVNGLKYSDNDEANQYAYRITTTAKDLAGNKLDTGQGAGPSTFFFTFATHYKTIRSDAALDGYIISSGGVRAISASIIVGDTNMDYGERGFLSFDLNSLPAGTLRIEDARVAIYPYQKMGNPNTLGQLRVVSVNYGDSLDMQDFDAAGIGNFRLLKPKVVSNPLKNEWVAKSFEHAVQDDWTNRASRGMRSQFKIYYEKKSNSNQVLDGMSFWSGNGPAAKRPYLWVKYLAP